MSHHPPIQVVNEHDEPIEGRPIEEVYEHGLIHRIAYVVVEDHDGNILLQKRSAQMVTNPHRWDISVGGHVDANETYIATAKREMLEELGLKDRQLQLLGKYYIESPITHKIQRRFVSTYKTIIPHNTPIHFDTHEVSAVEWLTLDAVKQRIHDHPEQVANGLIDTIERYY
jgi:isopentenyldiphosphate isomerase